MRVSLILLIFLVNISHLFALDKMNACFITINSSEEKEVFKKRLSTGKNAGKFEFHEFVPQNEGLTEWFDIACQSNIRCDILLISGHFGGTFFGSSKYRLAADELEVKSCKNSCQGLMSAPKEVFLMGCNTLAGKEKDGRTAAEYFDVLVADGYQSDEAARIADLRYGTLGSSFHDVMKRSFKNVPHLYGFSSVGPSGKNVETFLQNYHNKIPDYYDHLLKEEVKRGLTMMEDFSNWNKENLALKEALKATAFTQTSGIFIPECESALSKVESDPAYKALSTVCALKGDKLTKEEGMVLIESILSGPDFQLYFEAITSYITKHNLQKEMTQLIDKNPAFKVRLLSLLEGSQTPFGSLKILKSLHQIGLISKEEFTIKEKTHLLKLFKLPIARGTVDGICSYASGGVKVSLRASELTERQLKDEKFVEAASCILEREKSLSDSILNLYKKKNSSRVEKILLLHLLSNVILKGDQRAKSYLENELLRTQDEFMQMMILSPLVMIGEPSEKFYHYLEKGLRSKGSYTFAGAQGEIFEHALWLWSVAPGRDYAHFKKLSQLAGSRKSPISQEDFHWMRAKAIVDFPLQDKLSFFKDHDILPPIEHKKLRLRLYSAMSTLKSETEENTYYGSAKPLPLAILPNFLEDYKTEIRGQEQADLKQYISCFITTNEDEEDLLIREIVKRDFTKTELESFVSNMRTYRSHRLPPISETLQKKLQALTQN